MKTLLQIFDDVPNLQLLCVGKNISKISTPLQEGLSQSKGSVEELVQNEDITLDFTLPHRGYEGAVFFNVDYNHKNFVNLLLKVYDALETTATVIFVNEGTKQRLYDLIPLLEKGRLQNANSIEMLDNYDVVVAKKLQMWV